MDSRDHSLMSSSNNFLGLPRLLFPSTVPCNNSSEMLLCLETCPYHNRFLSFILLMTGCDIYIYFDEAYFVFLDVSLSRWLPFPRFSPREFPAAQVHREATRGL